jgi:hypothetical protein
LNLSWKPVVFGVEISADHEKISLLITADESIIRLFPINQITKYIFLVLLCHLRLGITRNVFCSDFQTVIVSHFRNECYTFRPSPPGFDHRNNISWRLLHYVVVSILILDFFSNSDIRTLVSNILILCSSFRVKTQALYPRFVSKTHNAIS